jgi:CDP-diacylglycerol--glycerol-3-phosphate 3-phosphatidyltransferase
MTEISVRFGLLKLAPALLTALRAILAPIVVLLAIYAPKPGAFAACLVAAFVSDVFDGIIARRLGVATPTLRRLDSAADTLFYAACVFAAWRLYPAAIRVRLLPLSILIALESLRYILDFAKFHREASYHMWSSKLWGIGLFVGFFSLLVFGSQGAAVSLALYLGIIADLEGIAISVILPRWQSDVPSFVHAMRAKRLWQHGGAQFDRDAR